MADQRLIPTDSRQSTGPSTPTETGPAGTSPTRLEAEQLNRWAELIATGQAPFPTELCEADQYLLAARVSELRRSRLVKFIARTIAQDIHRPTGP